MKIRADSNQNQARIVCQRMLLFAFLPGFLAGGGGLHGCMYANSATTVPTCDKTIKHGNTTSKHKS